MEKHWRTVVSRSVCDYFFEAQDKVSTVVDIQEWVLVMIYEIDHTLMIIVVSCPDHSVWG